MLKQQETMSLSTPNLSEDDEFTSAPTADSVLEIPIKQLFNHNANADSGEQQQTTGLDLTVKGGNNHTKERTVRGGRESTG